MIYCKRSVCDWEMYALTLFCLLVGIAHGDDPFKNTPRMPSSPQWDGILHTEEGDSKTVHRPAPHGVPFPPKDNIPVTRSNRETEDTVYNTVVGFGALREIRHHHRGHTIVGALSGNGLDGDEFNNTYVGFGIAGKPGENGVTRIGTPDGSGGVYLGSVYDAVVDGATARLLYIDSEGKIGTMPPQQQKKRRVFSCETASLAACRAERHRNAMGEIYRRLDEAVASGRGEIRFTTGEIYFDAAMQSELEATRKFVVSDLRQFYKDVTISIA